MFSSHITFVILLYLSPKLHLTGFFLFVYAIFFKFVFIFVQGVDAFYQGLIKHWCIELLYTKTTAFIFSYLNSLLIHGHGM